MKAIPCNEFPGYYEIPDFPNYAISLDAKIINKTSGEISVGFGSKRGYWIFQLRKNNKSKKLPRHRLMATIFKHPGCDVRDLEVNHIDGIKGSDTLDNLEWVTRVGNIEHAGRLGLTVKCVPISVMRVSDGTVTLYPSKTACARAMDLTPHQVAWRLKAGEDRVFPEGVRYRLGQVDKVWADIRTPDHIYGRSKRVTLRFATNDAMFQFDKLKEAAKALDISLPQACRFINDPNMPLINQVAQIQWTDDLRGWRLPEPHEFETKGNGRVMIVTEIDTGVERYVTGIRACAVTISSSVGSVANGLKRYGSFAGKNHRVRYKTV